jgi:hypothetical protein
MKELSMVLDSILPVTIVTGSRTDCEWWANLYGVKDWLWLDITTFIGPKDNNRSVGKGDHHDPKTRELVFAHDGVADACSNIFNYIHDQAQLNKGANVLLNGNNHSHRSTCIGEVTASLMNAMTNHQGGRLFNANLWHMNTCSKIGDYNTLCDNALEWSREPWKLEDPPNSIKEVFGYDVTSSSRKASDVFEFLVSLNYAYGQYLWDPPRVADDEGDGIADEPLVPHPPSSPPPPCKSTQRDQKRRRATSSHELQQFEDLHCDDRVVESPVDDADIPEWATLDPDKFPDCWYTFLRERDVDDKAIQKLFSLAHRGPLGRDAAAAIISQIISKECAGERIKSYSALVFRYSMEGHKRCNVEQDWMNR